MGEKPERQGDKVERITGGERQVAKEAAEGMGELNVAMRREMAEQKDTNRLPNTASQRFGRLELMDDDKVVVEGHQPVSTFKPVMHGDGGSIPQPMREGPKPTGDEIRHASSGTIHDASALVGSIKDPKNPENQTMLQAQAIVDVLQGKLINTIGANAFGMNNAQLGTRTANDIVHFVTKATSLVGGPEVPSIRALDNENRAEFDRATAAGDPHAMNPEFAEGVWNRGGGSCGPIARVANEVARQAGLDTAVVQAYVSDNHQNGHDVIVLNMAKGANAKDPTTWGKDAVYVDAQNNVILRNNVPDEQAKIKNSFLIGDGGVVRDVVQVHRNPATNPPKH
jgi:hypothetical protein